MAETERPYAGLQTRPVKALSASQVADLKEGRGMGFALAAELNGYPGPVHVLELDEPLGLSQAQRSRTKELLGAMTAETVPLGEQLLSLEMDLDRQFAKKTITEAGLEKTMEAIGSTRAKLRGAHLRFHLAMFKVLSPEQVARYNELRGYLSSAHVQDQHQGHQH